MIRTTSPRRTIGGLAALVILPVLMVGLSACAPGDGGNGNGSDKSAQGAGDSQSVTLAEWQLAYAECMRGEGIDMQDPSADGTQTMKMTGERGEQEAIETASRTCRDELGERPPMSAEDVAAADEAFLAYLRPIVACYRENGIDMPDPQAGESPQWPADVPDTVVQECGGGAGMAGKATD